jgi:hypothetical protein
MARRSRCDPPICGTAVRTSCFSFICDAQFCCHQPPVRHKPHISVSRQSQLSDSFDGPSSSTQACNMRRCCPQAANSLHSLNLSCASFTWQYTSRRFTLRPALLTCCCTALHVDHTIDGELQHIKLNTQTQHTVAAFTVVQLALHLTLAQQSCPQPTDCNHLHCNRILLLASWTYSLLLVSWPYTSRHACTMKLSTANRLQSLTLQ